MEVKEITEVNGNAVEELVMINVKSPIFLLFAEYLGYDSPNLEWCETWCGGKNIPSYQKSIIEVDAINIFNKLKEEYTIEDLHKRYQEYYDVIFMDMELKLLKLEDDAKSDLPY